MYYMYYYMYFYVIEQSDSIKYKKFYQFMSAFLD
jgi:hypothetical protein